MTPEQPEKNLQTGEHSTNSPSRVIESFMALCEAVSNKVGGIASGLDQIREPVRNHMLTHGWIQQIPTYPTTDYSIAAVDGSYRLDSNFAGDLMVATATSAPGHHSSGALEDVTTSWADFRAHTVEASEVARIQMFARELYVLKKLHHDIRIVDGTHINPLISLIRGFRGSRQLQETTKALLEELDIHDAIALLAAPHSDVVSLAKADTSTNIVATLRKHPDFQSMPTMVDKFLAALILEEGEMLLPQPTSTDLLEKALESSCGSTLPEFKAAESRFRDALNPLSETIKAGRLHNTYLRPVSHITTLKMQFVASSSNPRVAFEEIGAIAGAVSRECYGPHLQEPFPQYMADKAAKGASTALRYLRNYISSSTAITSSPNALLYLLGNRS